MRAKVAIVVAVLIAIAAVVTVFWLFPRQPHAGPWRLSDGSELSLAGVTYGKSHVMRYGDRLADYLYPVLPNALRKKFNCKVMTFPTADTNAIVVWLWDRGAVMNPNAPAFTPWPVTLTPMDMNGMHSWYEDFPSASVVWRNTNILYAIELRNYPRRSSEIGVQINQTSGGRQPLASFKVRNQAATDYPVWAAMPLPVTVKTNNVEVALVEFETRLNERGTLPITHLRFKIADGKSGSEELAIRQVSAQSATGEIRNSASVIDSSNAGKEGTALVADIGGVLWSEEPAWKVTAEFWRLTNYPAAELWTVKNVQVPAPEQTLNVRATTNIYGSDIELMTIRGGALKTNALTGEVGRAPAVVHVMSPIPSPDVHLRLAGVTDDRGRVVEYYFENEVESTGGRGATLRELRQYYALSVAPDAKSVDVTLAYTKSISVEFMAKPTVVK